MSIEKGDRVRVEFEGEVEALKPFDRATVKVVKADGGSGSFIVPDGSAVKLVKKKVRPEPPSAAWVIDADYDVWHKRPDLSGWLNKVTDQTAYWSELVERYGPVRVLYTDPADLYDPYTQNSFQLAAVNTYTGGLEDLAVRGDAYSIEIGRAKLDKAQARILAKRILATVGWWD